MLRSFFILCANNYIYFGKDREINHETANNLYDIGGIAPWCGNDVLLGCG